MTPGTNLLALYAVLGHRLGGWPLAIQAILVGALLPAVLAVLVAVVYTHADWPVLTRLMAGARAGGVAVFIGAAVRLIRPQLTACPVLGGLLAVALALVTWFTSIGVFAVLLAAGAFGAVLLRP